MYNMQKKNKTNSSSDNTYYIEKFMEIWRTNVRKEVLRRQVFKILVIFDNNMSRNLEDNVNSNITEISHLKYQ